LELAQSLDSFVDRSADPTDRLAERVRLAYLVSEYPAISHTFILREVRRLRALGFEIFPASINSPRQAVAEMTAADRDEARRTFYIKSAGASAALRAHLETLCKHPLAYLRGLGVALSLGGGDLRQLVFSVFYFTEALILGDWMRRHGLRHVHVHFINAAATVGLITSRIFGTGFSLTVHGPDEFYDVYRLRLKEKIQGAAFVFCISQFARSQLMKLVAVPHWPKLEMSRLGVDPGIFKPRPFRIAPSPLNLLCVGRLVPAKGQHVLIAALGRLIRGGRSVTLRLVGDGPDRASLEDEVASRGLSSEVSFTGSVNQDQIRRLYSEADVFVLASFAEGIPIVLMEAMAMEIPCVSTTVAGISELIRNEVDGLLVPPSDERALAEAIERLIDDRELRRRLGQAARRRIMDQFDLDQNVERLARLFTARLAAGPHASTARNLAVNA
jgi:colanic acid/amylovoran biosynthesis glycosyltransferase